MNYIYALINTQEEPHGDTMKRDAAQENNQASPG